MFCSLFWMARLSRVFVDALLTHILLTCAQSICAIISLTGLLEKIAELVNDKKLEGIADLRDETDRDGMRMVIELKKDAVPAVVQNNLFKKTALQTSFPGNMLALVEEGTQPRRITLREALKVFIAFRYDFKVLMVIQCVSIALFVPLLLLIHVWF